VGQSVEWDWPVEWGSVRKQEPSTSTACISTTTALINKPTSVLDLAVNYALR